MSELDDFWTLYAVEGRDSLDVVEESLLALSAQPASKDVIGRLFRSMHTFKGNSRMMGLSNIEKLAHVAEDMIGLVRDYGVALDEEMLDLLIETSDMFRDMAEDAIAHQRDVSEEMGAELYLKLTALYQLRLANKSTISESGIPSEIPIALVQDEINLTVPTESPTPEPVIRQVVDAVAIETPTATDEAQTDESQNDELQVEEPQAILFDPIDTSSLANDPVYREIFFSLAEEILAELTNTLLRFDEDETKAREAFTAELERLIFASEQIGMRLWSEMTNELRQVLDQQPPKEALQLALEQLLHQYEVDQKIASSHTATSIHTVSEEDHHQQMRAFFVEIGVFIQELTAITDASQKQQMSDENAVVGLMQALALLKDQLQSLGYVRLLEVIDQLSVLAKTTEPVVLLRVFPRYEFQLYEGLAQIQDLELPDDKEIPFNAVAHLRYWCAEKAFETLINLSEVTRELQNDKSLIPQAVPDIKFMLTCLHYTAQYYSLGSASHLSLALVDLFERVRQGSLPPDVILLHITKSFVEDMEIVLNSVASGHTPDMAHIEGLLNKAATATFEAQGNVSAASIEARLSLPKSFHKVLTPESVDVAIAALDAGELFYIIRADLDQYADLAEHFLAWVHSGVVKVISNVTVLRGNRTVFDFLVSATLDRSAIISALTSLDPNSKALTLELALKDRKHEEAKVQREAQSTSSGSVGHSASMARESDLVSMNINTRMMDSIGELVTSQGIVNHLVTSISDVDLMSVFDDQMRMAGGDWKKARASLRLFMEHWMAQFEQLKQTNAKMSGMLESLQEDALQLRVRPAVTLMKPMESFVADLAGMCMKKVSLSLLGDKEMLDADLLEQLKSPLRSLVAFMITQSIQSPEGRITEGKSGVASIRIALRKYDDRVEVDIRDDGMGLYLPNIEARMTQLGWSHLEPCTAVLRRGFGSILNPNASDPSGVDLANIADDLRLQGGNLVVRNLEQGGLLAKISLPLAMLVQEGMVVRVGTVHYVIPIDVIRRIVRPDRNRLMDVSAEGGQRLLKLEEGSIIAIVQLMKANQFEGKSQETEALSLSQTNHHYEDVRRIFVIVEKQGVRIALEIDELLGQQQVLVRPLLGYLSGIRGVSGCALLGSGEVGMVVDVGYLVSDVDEA